MTDPARPFLDTAPFSVARWHVQPSLLRAAHAGEVRQLEPKVMGVLCTLALHAGEAVTRRDLFDTVWADTIVSDDVLTRCISELRKLFGDDARAQRIIETVPRVGYCLLAPVTWSPTAGDSLPDAPLVRPSHKRTAPTRIRWPLWVALLLCGAALLTVGYGLGYRPPPAARPLTVTPVTVTPGLEMAAALSPDGTRLAFVRSADGERHLFVSAADGSDPLQLTGGRGGAWSPTWSPDGRTLAFVQHDDGCAVQTIPALGGPARTLAACRAGASTSLDWSPDGQSLATEYAESPDAPTALALLDIDTGEVEPLAYDRGSGGAEFGPRWSPDGTRLLFVRSLGEGLADLFVLDIESGRTTRVTDARGGIVGQDWIDDGEVLYSVLHAGHASFWRTHVSPDGPVATPEWVPISDEGYRLTTAGPHAVFERWDIEAALSRLALDRPAELRPFASSTAYDHVPQWSPDGKRIAFLSDRSGALQVWTSDADGTHAAQQTDLDGVLCSPPRWSPDGRRLAFAARVGGKAEVFVLDYIGAQPRVLAVPASNEVHPSWAPDGQWLFVSSDRSGRSEIWSVPVSGGEAVRVTHEGGVLAQPSPDGQWLYVLRPGEAGLWRQPLAGGPGERVYDDLPAEHLFAWQPYDGGLYVAEPAPDGTLALVAHGMQGERETLRSLGAGRVPGFAVSPDGADVLLWRVTSREADLVRATLND